MLKQILSAHPPCDTLIVHRRAEQKSEGSIVEPDNDNPERLLQGVIVRRGPGIPTQTGEFIDMIVGTDTGTTRVVANDIVLYKLGDIERLKIATDTFDLVKFRDVIMVFKNEKDYEGGKIL